MENLAKYIDTCIYCGAIRKGIWNTSRCECGKVHPATKLKQVGYGDDNATGD